MGDAAVAGLVKEVVRRLTSLAIQEFDLLWALKDDISSLKKDFDRIEAVLEDAEEKHAKEKAVGLWLRDLRSVSLMAENVLDEVSTEALLQRLHKQRVKYRVRAFFSSNHNKFMSRVRIAHKVKDIRRKLDDIASRRLFELNLTPSDGASHVDVDVAGEMPDRETSSLIHNSSAIFGRNEDMEMIIRKICNKDVGKYENGEIRVYGIWGMGGVGKTTLAQLVYNNESVNQYFDFKCWVYISEKFQVKEIIKGIIESIDECKCELTRLDLLQKSLQLKLRGKIFFIVLDDVWIEDDEKAKWEELSKTLSCGAEGSTILMTTRSSTTSRMMAKVGELQHELGCLSEEDSWLLFKKFAFAQGREGGDISELEPIGREIVKKCEGLPLAVKTLGSLMWSTRSTRDWEHVKHNIIWNLEENKVLPALKLSYDNLLPNLKRCFGYCCLFPKGYELEKDVLIPLWLSNGFIPPRGEMDLYVIGEEIFNCLVWRSFFQVVKADKYKIHDLMHDMAQHVIKHDCVVIDHASKEVKLPDEVLHLSSSCPDILLSPEDLRSLTSLRSIIMLGRINDCRVRQISNHAYLRVLYLCGSGLRTLHESICKLKHLRYLNLSNSGIEVLPESIIYLQNLRVLILSNCYNLRKLPEGLRYMRNLEHLDIKNQIYFKLLHLPFGIKELTRLRSLSNFPVGEENGAKVEELGDLNLLEGKLEISRLQNVRDLSEAKSANLKSKTNLSVLMLYWPGMSERESKPQRFSSDEEVLQGLEPNPCLKELKIQDYRGKIISPSWMVNLSNLVKIMFHGCEKCEHIPPLGRLPNLRIIVLWKMDSLKYFHDDDIHVLENLNTANMFLSLRELHVSFCPKLVSLPCKSTKLVVLEIEGCGELVSLPCEILKDLTRLKIRDCKHLSLRYEKEMGEDWSKISHIPNIRIDPPWFFS